MRAESRVRRFPSAFWYGVMLLVVFAVMRSPAVAFDSEDPFELLLDTDALLAPEPVPPAAFGMYFRPHSDAYSQLRPAQRVILANFPLTDSLRVDLQLERYYAHLLGAQFVLGTEDGDVAVPEPELAMFRGQVVGWADSWVVLGVTQERMYGIIRVGTREEYWLAPPPPELADLPHVIYERYSSAGQFGPFEFRCGTALLPTDVPLPVEPGRVVTPSAEEEEGAASGNPPRVAALALEGDWEYRQLFGSHTAALEYMALLTAVVSAIYERDVDLKIAIVYARVWNTSNDPYSATNMNDALGEFQTYWTFNMGAVQRDLANMVSGRAFSGGLAYLSQLCTLFSYGINRVDGTFPYPVQSRTTGNEDIIVFAHEMGHNFGSPHTHCYSPPVDRCYTEEDGCASGTRSCQPGEIMSYCHQCTGGVTNIDLLFSSRVVTRIRDYVNGACPRVARNPCYVNGNYTGDEQGTSASPYRTIRRGFQYVLSGGRVLAAPGSYDETFTGAYLLNRPAVLDRQGASGSVVIGQ